MYDALVFSVAVAMALHDAPVAQDARDSDGVTIQEVLTEIQRGLSDAQQILVAAKMPPLDSVVLNLQTDYNVQGGPKFKLLIFSFGKSWERQRSNELVLTLKPPKPSAEVQVSTGPGLANQLVAAIVAAAQGVKAAESGTPPLQLATLKAEFGFVVKESSSAGVKFEIVPVSADLKADWSKKAVHTITVTFAGRGGKS